MPRDQPSQGQAQNALPPRMATHVWVDTILEAEKAYAVRVCVQNIVSGEMTGYMTFESVCTDNRRKCAAEQGCGRRH